MNWMNQVTVAPAAPAVEQPVNEVIPMALELERAAQRFAQRTDGFAQGKADICNDIAAKLRRFGSFASDKQREFAVKLVAWSKPREQQAAPAQPQAPAMPKTFALMQRFAKVRLGGLELARRNQDSLCWVKYQGALIGKLDGAGVALFPAKVRAAGADSAGVIGALVQLERDPVNVLAEHGKLSGRCACCGRDLTDPESISFGIGPVCRGKLAGGF